MILYGICYLLGASKSLVAFVQLVMHETKYGNINVHITYSQVNACKP